MNPVNTLNKRAQLRHYILKALDNMSEAEDRNDDTGMLDAARNIEHLARELRGHAEEHGL